MSDKKRGRSPTSKESTSPAKKLAPDRTASTSLPLTVDLSTFVNCRKDELQSLTNAVKTKQHKLVSQQLPKHMRRRIVSHNRKRLPKRLQARAGSPEAKTSKRPSRLHRRRPRNLLEEYNRRSRENAWLETHIWHAKRFHMVAQYNHKIPFAPCDKGIRAAYRGAAKYCLLTDMSYYQFIEICGKYQEITDGFSKITSPETGLTIKAMKYKEGKFEGKVWIYDVEKYPFGCLGQIQFLWCPSEDLDGERKLWMWCHPALKTALTELLEKIFPAEDKQDDDDKDDTSTRKCGVIVNSSTINVNRFRLTGPLSLRILCDAMTQDYDQCDNEVFKLKPDYFNDFWAELKQRSLSGSYFIKDGTVVGNLVKDPRLHMPKKRQVSTVVSSDGDTEHYWPDMEIPFHSDIWSPEVREYAKESMKSQNELNKIAHDNLIPGEEVKLGKEENRIPLLVIFNSGDQKHLGYSRGCDIIIPAGWGRQFFIALNHRSARASGLRDTMAVLRYSSKFVFPDDVPDSAIAGVFHKAETKAAIEKHLRYPPDKRPAFQTLGVILPYSFPFASLLDSWCPVKVKQLYVLRNKSILQKMSKAMNMKGNEFAQVCQAFFTEAQTSEILIAVNINCYDRGVPQRFARIYNLAKDPLQLFEPVHMCTKKERMTVEGDLLHDSINARMDNIFPLIGFMVTGDRNYTTGRAGGLGYVSLKALLATIGNDNDYKIAFRNQTSFQYVMVEMQIVTDVNSV